MSLIRILNDKTLVEWKNKDSLDPEDIKRLPEPILANNIESKIYSYAVSVSREKLEKKYIQRARQLKTAFRNMQGSIVDVGSGKGISSFALAKIFSSNQVLGLDIDLNETLSAIRQYELGNLEFQTGDANNINQYVENPIMITSFNTIHHFENTLETFKEIYDVLKPGGVFYFEDFDRSILKLDTLKKLQRYHKLREYFGDERSINHYMKRKSITLNEIQYLSIGAAYTGGELMDLGRKVGFNYRLMKVEDGFLRGVFKKPDLSLQPSNN